MSEEETKKDATDKYGEAEKETPNIINANRKCRDVLCLLLFLIAWIAWIIFAIMAFSDGCPDNCNDPRKLIFGYDSNGCRCGVDCSSSGGPDNRNKLNIYIPDPRQIQQRLCVKSCPSTFTNNKTTSNDLGIYLCPFDSCSSCPASSPKGDKCFANERKAPSPFLLLAAKTDSCFLPTSNSSDCWFPTYPTSEVFYKCLPSIPSNLNQSLVSLPFDLALLSNSMSALSNPAGEIGEMAAEFSQIWRLLVVAVALALIMGFVYLLLVRLMAKCMMFITLFGLLIVMGLCSLFAWDKSGKIQIFAAISKASGVNVSAIPGVNDAMKTPTEPGVSMAAAVIFTILTIVYAIILCIMIKRLIIAIDIIQEAAKSMAAMPTLLLLPLTTSLALIFLYLWAGFIAMYLLSAGQFDPVTGKFVYSGGTCSKVVAGINVNLTQATTIITLRNLSVFTSPTLTIMDDQLKLSDTITSPSMPIGACLGYSSGLASNCSAAITLKSLLFTSPTRVGGSGTLSWDASAGSLYIFLPLARAAWPTGDLKFSVNLHRPSGGWDLSGTFPDGASWTLQSSNVTSRLGGLAQLEATRLCNLYGSTAKATASAIQAKYSALSASMLSDVNELPSSSFLSGISMSNWKSALPVTLDGSTYNYFVVFHIFMFLWTNAFLSSSGFFIVCGAVAGWYWAEDKRDLGPSPVLSSVRRYVRYNLGTVACGSFIIAVVQLIRILFNYYVNQCNKLKDNPIAKALVCIANCCLWCIEKIIGFINRNAYIMSATHGHGFCTAAFKGFCLIMRNLLRVAAINTVAAVILFFGKLFILFSTLGLSYVIGQSMAKSMGLVNGVPILALIFIGLMAWFIACGFLSVFEAAVDTIFLSFLYDSEANNGKDRPYRMAESLQHAINVRNSPAVHPAPEA